MRTRLVADPQAPGAARSYVSRQLARADVPAGVQVDDVVLIASELVTNAVRAGADWVDLTLRVAPDRLDLLVEDDADGTPVMVDAADDDVSGRGLGIVDQLADSWVVTPRATGKLVTASWLDGRS